MRVSVDVDVYEVLDEISTEELMNEIKKRNKVLRAAESPKKMECQQTLDTAAFELRKAGKIASAHRLDEIKQDYFT